MILSNQIRYATRGLLFLAMRYGADPIPLRRIAEAEGISEKYLEAIFAGLRRGQLVESEKGKHGGYRLCSAPDKLTLLDVVRVFEPDLVAGEISENEPDYAVWKDVEDAMVQKLGTITLESLVESLRDCGETLYYTI